ncbi:MAG TPA: hypothetical protein VE974_26565 [Thermoanaerobaculia bacterium]|nr:hypothetical protein [Thermoanaerobaculia bacterium]
MEAMPKQATSRILCLAFLLTATVAGTSAAATAQPPQVTLSEDRIVVTNVTSGQSVVLFGAAQQFSSTGSVQLKRWQRATADDDRDGRVEFKLPELIPTQSIWFVVDSATGAAAIVAPPESRFRQLQFPAATLRKNQHGQLDQFVSGRGMVDLLIVRPRVGAWAAFAADGHDSDADGVQNGRTAVDFSRGRSLVGRVPAPRQLTPRDVVVAIDVRRLQFYLTEVNQ